MDDDVSTRAKLRLTGNIEIGYAGVSAHLTGIELRREDADWRMRLDGPLSELRNLKVISPAYGTALARVADSPEDAMANISLLAPPDLARDLTAAQPEEALPQEWLDHEAFAGLVFVLDRWEPESVGIVVGSSG